MIAESAGNTEITEGSDPVLLSMLEHFSYCPRQCALIHIEQCYLDNVFTLKGKEGHERVDEAISEVRDGIRIEHALPLYNRKLKLIGKADIVEFSDGIPYPIEYKHGSRAGRVHCEIQLCGQALCLEEMFRVEVRAGAIYALRTHRRREVKFTSELREHTIAIIEKVRSLISGSRMPFPVNDKRCPNCSLIDICQPAVFAQENRSILSDEWLKSHLVEGE